MASLGSIIYGTAWKKEETTRLVVAAFKAGFRSVDTAGQPKHYREELVGDALHALYEGGVVKRADVWIQTKFTPLGGHDLSKPIPYDRNASIPDRIAESFASSQRNLRADTIDSYLLHSPFQTLEETLEAWRVLAKLRSSGKVKLIGVSNVYDLDILKALHESGERCDVVQNRWHENNDWSRAVATYCRQNGIVFQSFWSLTGSPRLLANPNVTSIAKTLNCTPAQVVYKLAQSVGVTPLAGSTNEAHMRDGVSVQQLDVTQPEVASLFKQLQGLITGDT